MLLLSLYLKISNFFLISVALSVHYHVYAIIICCVHHSFLVLQAIPVEQVTGPLNHLRWLSIVMVCLLQFGTTFEEMDAMSGRHQTTKGIWLAKGQKIEEPSTLVLDLEGSDGRERGEDDNSFERQSSLFALAVADVLLVNMWAKDVGREAGAGKPLLKTIFQVRSLLLFTSNISLR